MNEVEAVKTESQRTQVLAQLEAHGQLYADVWQFGINTALRISDLLALTMQQLKDVDPECPELTLIESKTKKRKTVTLNTISLEVVNRRMREHPDDTFLFQSTSPRYGKRGPAMAINRRSVSRIFEKVGQQIAPKVKLGTHSMRKTRGYAMHKDGRPIEAICRMLNHSHPAVTMKYIGLTKEDTQRTYTEFVL